MYTYKWGALLHWSRFLPHCICPDW